MSYDVPDNIISGLKGLLSLDPADFDAMEACLLGNPNAANPAMLVAQALSESAKSPSGSIVDALTALISLQIARDTWANDSNLLNSVFDSAKESGKFKTFSDKALDSLKHRLAKILESPSSLKTAAKAFELLQSQPFLIKETRIFSDIRAVFGFDEDVKPPSAVLFHTLKFECATSEGEKTLFLTATDNSLAALKTAIERAEKKSVVLRQTLADSSISCLEI